jgi:hypothetical protein
MHKICACRVTVVTGVSHGTGGGIAAVLGEHGVTVYVMVEASVVINCRLETSLFS